MLYLDANRRRQIQTDKLDTFLIVLTPMGYYKPNFPKIKYKTIFHRVHQNRTLPAVHEM
jgi:hypothetical protein